MLPNIEDRIKDYIDNFYSIEDLQQLIKPTVTNAVDDTIINDLNYKNLCNKIFQLFQNSHLANKYRIEIDETCSDLIKKLFKTYVDKNTFIVTSNNDHQAVTSLLGDNERSIVNIFDTSDKIDKAIQKVILDFKQSNCNRIFCIMAGTAPQSTITVPQEFFIKLKEALIKENIEHLMILDNCQGMFIIERDYEIFDAFLATGHVLSCLFSNIGLLFTKLPKQIGYINKQTLTDIYPNLEIISKYRNKALQFNSLMNEYFESVLEKTDFKQFKNEAPHQFAISLPNTINHTKYDNKFMYYGIRFNPIENKDNFVRIRYHESIIQDSNIFIEGLKELKKHLIKLSRFKEIANDKLNYSQLSRDSDLTLNKMVQISPNIEKLLTIDQQELIFKRFLYSAAYRSR